MPQIIKIIKDVPLTNVVADIEHLFSEICDKAGLALEADDFPALTITGTPSTSILDAATLGGKLPSYYDITLRSISDLRDVDTTNISDGYILTWNEDELKWKGKAVELVTRLNDILDIQITNPSNNDILIYEYNTGNWINSKLTDIGAILGPDSSVDDGIVLFNGTTGKVVKDSGQTLSSYMLKSVYDPLSMNTNAFHMDNMIEGTNTKIMTSAERDKLANATVGPANSIDGGIAVFDGTTGKVIKSTNKKASDLVTGPASATDDAVAAYSGTTGKVIKSTNKKASDLVTGPASAVDGNLAVFDGATGKIIKDAGIALNPLTSSVTLTVGSGGQYTTINAALEYAVKKYYPIFLSGDTKPRVTIQLQAGFVMAEQVLVESLDLSWITITGVDAETVINRSALTTFWGGDYPAFGVMNGGFLPIIGQLFNMNTSGTASDRHGILAYLNSRAIVLGGCGVKNAGSIGICADCGSTINAGGANASGAGTFGIFAYRSSTINADGVNASGAGSFGICAAYGSTINAEGANASGAVSYGIYAYRGSTINANGANASGAVSYGICAAYGSTINAEGATGTLSQAKNTLTAHGIIFQF